MLQTAPSNTCIYNYMEMDDYEVCCISQKILHFRDIILIALVNDWDIQAEKNSTTSLDTVKFFPKFILLCLYRDPKPQESQKAVLDPQMYKFPRMYKNFPQMYKNQPQLYKSTANV